jgi:hypothetical protein
MIADLCQRPVAEGTVVAAAGYVGQQIAPVNTKIKNYLIYTEDPVRFDETGVRINGKLNWCSRPVSNKPPIMESINDGDQRQ